MKKGIWVLLFLYFSSFLFALELYMADIHVLPQETDITVTDQEKEITDVIFKKFLARDYGNLITFKRLSRSHLAVAENNDVRSDLDASEMCDLLHVQYILYGTLGKTYTYYELKLVLFDNEKKNAHKVYYEKVAIDDFPLLIESISEKYISYFYSLLGYKNEEELAHEMNFGGIALQYGNGYWFPGGSWWQAITGLFSLDTGVKFIAETPLGKTNIFRFSLRPGFRVFYAMGINKPSYTRSYYHILQFTIPLETCFEILQHHVFALGFGPQLHLDIIYQERIFDNPLVSARVAFSLFGGINYEYWFGKKKTIAFGVENMFNVTFYSPVLFEYRLHLYLLYRIPFQGKYKRRIPE